MKTKSEMESEIAQVRGLISSGQLDYAQFECTRLVSEYPNKIAPLCMMSYILYIQANYKNAVRYAFLAQEKLDSDSDWKEVVSVSNALLMVAEEKAALDVMKLINDKAKLDSFGCEIVAKHFGKLDQLEAAADLFSSVPDPNSMNYHSWQMYGVTLTYLGRNSEAITMFKKAIEINPTDGISYHQLSGMNIADGREERINEMQNISDREGLDPVNKSYMHFALYNEHEAKADLDQAFKNLKVANDVRKNSVKYDSIQERTYYEHIANQFSELPIVDKSHGNHGSDANPIFIVGMPRTGTTLLEKVLSRYSEVHACGELRTLRMQIQAASGLQIQEPNDIGKIESFSRLPFDRIGSEYLRNVLWRTGGSKWFTDKHPSNYVFCGIIAHSLPGARIIHITKNPMDACFSNYRQYFTFNSYTYSYSLSDLAVYYKNYKFLMDFWHQMYPSRILHVCYENLVLNPDLEAERIREFCGFSEEIKNDTEFVTNTLSALQVRKPIHDRNINGWARYAEQLSTLREALNEEYIAYMKKIDGVKIL